MIKAKVMIARALCSPPLTASLRRITGGIVPSRGMRIDTRSPEVSDYARGQLLWGLYEGAECRMVRRHLRPRPWLVDLGASLGVLTSYAARMMGDVDVLFVEANPRLLPLAQRNLARNAPRARVHPVHGAVAYGTSATHVHFESTTEHTAARLATDRSQPPAFSAPVVRLGDLLEGRGIDDFVLLMDIEGAEAGLLYEDPDSLNSCRQLIVELHQSRHGGREMTPQDLLGRLIHLGFRLVENYGSVAVLERD